MTPRERAQCVAAEHSAPQLRKLVDMIEQAITTAIEEDRKSRPHIFIGRNDRDCELCGNPDRDEIHCVKREWMSNAIKQEREACAKIADEEVGAMNGVIIECGFDLERAKRVQTALNGIDRIGKRIRAQSEGEGKGEKTSS